MSAAQWPAMPGALVVARFARIHGDGTDTDDRPDWIAPEGTELSFVPSITGPLVYDPAGARIIVEVAPFHAVVDSDGFAVAKDGGHPIKLAPTDDPMMSRTGWLWTCSWAGGKVSFPAPSSGTVNLADFIVAPPDNPVVEEWVARIPKLVDVAGSLVSIDTVTEDAGDIVVALTDGEVYRFPMPPGPSGERGEKGDKGADSTVPGPKGDTGADGRGIESITDDDEDGIATVLYTDGVTGALPLPRGPQGDAAPKPEIAWAGDVLTVDGVSSPPLSGPAGPAPATSWSGTSLIVGDNPPVDLRGPVGERGPIGSPGAVATASDYLLVGPGRPDTPATTGGIITGSEPVGCEYRSTDGAGVGAWTWSKRPTGWEAVGVDTEWRAIQSLATVGVYVSGEVAIRRIGRLVEANFSNLTLAEGSAALDLPIPTGFRPRRGHRDGWSGGFERAHVGNAPRWTYFWSGNPRLLIDSGVTARMQWLTDEPVPAALPGTPA